MYTDQGSLMDFFAWVFSPKAHCYVALDMKKSQKKVISVGANKQSYT